MGWCVSVGHVDIDRAAYIDRCDSNDSYNVSHTWQG